MEYNCFILFNIAVSPKTEMNEKRETKVWKVVDSKHVLFWAD